jgi:predicted metalloendopeptidase
VQSTPVEIWREYLRYRLLDANGAFLSEAFDRARFEFRERALSGVQAQQPRWRRGLRLIDRTIGEIAGRLYVEKKVPPEARERIREPVANLRRAFAPSIDSLKWMGPQTVNAYYSPPMNEIVFPAAILRPSFFDPATDDAVNYGGIGGVIGHDISHGFDDNARFRERAGRPAAQYETYQPIEGRTINRNLTLGEKIGDLSGLAVAYRAYHVAGRACGACDRWLYRAAAVVPRLGADLAPQVPRRRIALAIDHRFAQPKRVPL